MHRVAYLIAHRVATDHWLAMACGLIVAGLGIAEVTATGEGTLDVALSVEFGLALAGLLQCAFGVVNVVLGARLVGIGILGAEHEAQHPVFNRMLKGVVESPRLVFVLGVVLLAMVARQIWIEWVLGAAGEARSVWYFGLGLMAILAIARSAENVLLALGMMADGETRGKFVVRVANSINRHVRKPWLLMLVASLCIALGIAEELFVAATAEGTGAFIAHYGFLLFAVLEAGKLVPIVFVGAILADEGLASPRAGSPDEALQA